MVKHGGSGEGMCITHEGIWSMFVVMCEHVGETCDTWWQVRAASKPPSGA